MKLLGAVLAGGRSRRFGSDKAVVEIDGVAMLDHVAHALAAECGTVIVIGRDWPGLMRVDDLPAPGLGPLGGLAGALVHAAREGFDTVLTSGCDLPALPGGLTRILERADTLLKGQPTVGLWSPRHADALQAWLSDGGDRSIRGWADHIGARYVTPPAPLANINTPGDLAAFRQAGPRSSP